MKDFKMIDLQEAEAVELMVDKYSKLWLNVDGKCAVRIGKVNKVHMELPDYPTVTHS